MPFVEVPGEQADQSSDSGRAWRNGSVHRPNLHGVPRHAVFVDATGQRARRSQHVYRTFVVVGLAAIAAFAISVLGGVPLPGLSGPVTLPSDEPAQPRAGAVAAPARDRRTKPDRSSAGPAQAGPTPAIQPPAPTPTRVGAAARPSLSRAAHTPASSPAAATTAPTPARRPTRTSGATPTRTTGVTPTPGRHTTPAPATRPASPTPGRHTTPAGASSHPPRGRRITTPPAHPRPSHPRPSR